MSNKVFLPKNTESASFNQVLSATSSVPNWLKGGNDSNASENTIQREVRSLLNEAVEMKGGAKKRSGRKGGKKSSKRSSKKSSKKQSGGAGKKRASGKKASKKGSKKSSKKSSRRSSKKQSGGAKKSSKKQVAVVAKKSSKKSSKRSSKKSSKKHSMSRELPAALVKHREFVEYIQNDMKLKGGPVTISFASSYKRKAKESHPNASPDELNDIAKKLYNEDKKNGVTEKKYKAVEKDMADKRKAKKDAKA
jgi:hypothetical protein